MSEPHIHLAIDLCHEECHLTQLSHPQSSWQSKLISLNYFPRYFWARHENLCADLRTLIAVTRRLRMGNLAAIGHCCAMSQKDVMVFQKDQLTIEELDTDNSGFSVLKCQLIPFFQ